MEQEYRIPGPNGRTLVVTANSREAAQALADQVFAQMAPGGVSVNAPAAQEMADSVGSATTDAMVGLRNGLSLGFMDNMRGAVEGGLMGGVPSESGTGTDFFNYDTPTADRYAAMRDRVRSEQDTAAERSPGLNMAGNIVGAAVPGAAASPALLGKGLLQTMASMGLFGAGEGALIGAGNADGENVLRESALGAGIGGLTGALAVPAVAAARAASRPAGGLLSAITGRGSEARAGAPIARALERSGMSVNDVQARVADANAAGQHMYTLADTSGPMQRLLNGVVRSPGAAGEEASQALLERQLGQSDRVAQQISRATGIDETAEQYLARLERERSAAAKVNYPAAREGAQPVVVDAVLARIDERLGPMANDAGITGDGIDNRLSSYRARLAGENPDGSNVMMSDFDRVLGVKQQMQDDIGAAVRAGRNNEARVLGDIVRELDTALEASSDGYRLANDTFRSQSQVMDAMPEGQRVASRPNGQISDIERRFAALNEQQRQAFTASFQDNLFQSMQNAPATKNAARDLTMKPRQRSLLDMVTREGPTNAQAALPPPGVLSATRDVAPTRQNAALFDQLARENDMFSTYQMTSSGSRTADNLADQADTVSDIIGTAAQAVASPGGAALSGLTRIITNMVGGQDEMTRNILGRALMSQDPVAALQPLLRSAEMSEQAARSVEALIRQASQEVKAAL